MGKETTYKDAGVNIELGDNVSEILYNAAKKTWINRKGLVGEVIELFEGFSGSRAVHFGGLPKGTYGNLSFDGVGTKVNLGQRLMKHDTVAYDLLAMVCDDAVVRGAEPILVGSVLDSRNLSEDNESYIDFVRQLAIGYIGAAKAANVAIVNGETAELGVCVSGYTKTPSFIQRVRGGLNYIFKGQEPPKKGFHYNWGAGVLWLAPEDRLFKGNEIKEGDSIVAFHEEGLRSNGLSLFRKIMEKNYGNEWHTTIDGKYFADKALTPSQIYTPAVVEMHGGVNRDPKVEIHGVAHITGGGIPGKLGRVLKPSGLSAKLDDLFEPLLMKDLQELGNVADREAYKTWNMRQGMLVITPSPNEVIRIASRYNIGSKLAGKVVKTKNKPIITIVNEGRYNFKEPELVYDIT